MNDLSGKTIRGYTLHESIGAGGFGTVYRAVQQAVGREVAIKVIRPQFASDPEFVRRFEVEARTISRLEHPYIVPLIDFGQEGDVIYLVMRWLRGGSLRARIRQGALSFETAAKLMNQVSEALAKAHQEKVIHRDLKPDNILFDEDGNAYLTDFGIAKDFIASLKDTSSGKQMGTPSYAPSEQFSSQTPAPQIDIYSLGITIYEALTGQHPFPQAPMRHWHEPLPPLRMRRADAPPGLDGVLMQATAKDPADRYPDMNAFNSAFQQAISGSMGAPQNPPAAVDTPVFHPSTLFSEVVTPQVALLDRQLEAFVFISHSSQDDEVVERVRGALVAGKVNAWVDHIYIQPGDDWDQEIQDMLNACEDGLFVMSRRSAASAECRSEWRRILALKKRLYVVLVDDIPPTEFPFRLGTTQYIDLRGDFEEGMARLIAQMRQDRGAAHRPPRHVPASAGTEPARLLKTAEDVPFRADKLIGREALLKRTLPLLKPGKRVLLWGFGGVGKTALAAETVARYLTRQGGQALWLTVGSESAESLLEALGEPVKGSLTQFTEQSIHDRLAEEKIGLVVLDNVWVYGTTLKRLLQAIPRQIPVLVTSRHAYALNEIVEVKNLERRQAVLTLQHYAGQRFKAGEADELCQKLGNHPFALEIAGNIIKIDKWTPTELLQRIASAPHSLRMPLDFSLEKRESVKELLDASINALDPTVARVFLAFGAQFTASATPELLSLYLEYDLKLVDAALVELGRRSLANREGMSYRVHDLAFSYARQAFDESGQDERAVIEACREYVDKNSGNLKALDAERANLLLAAEAAEKTGHADWLTRMMWLLAVEGPYFTARGYNALTFRLMNSAIEYARKDSQRETAHYLLSKLGNGYRALDQLDRALEAYQEALQLARELKDRQREGILLTVIGTVRMLQKADDVNSYFERAFQIAQADNDYFVMSQNLEHRGHYASEKDNHAAARDLFVESLAIAEKIDDPEQHEDRRFWAIMNQGVAERKLGNGNTALPLHELTLRIAQVNDNKIWMGYALQEIGEDHHALGEYKLAQEYLNQALALYRETEVRSDILKLIAIMKECGYPIPPE